ncbi:MULTISPECIES: ABC transporter substrate-binding protein [Exiguobacterium]|uniref:Extracellular solute-binding protein family 1 n=1 Tax=Exiguobacterium sibiricum (strain DSM 17290 / CCUG 55495 / CIP 109462 / JCM 13490 / 255-15) TaxID=262543 RepID=B1YJN7_EXIS2|nr:MULTISPECIES: extracellular solute-binding protein [Exiguobacterium]ACB60067.1 extracellular solute-binding protein family 1 [Exiguobacterium sibiricum 255-15]MCT4791540.1 extracellular solute-binding protein [Exiguobacterium artemiae]MDX1260460.1 extracellular solute-binding protein [Exiguobacterium sp. K1]
MRKRKWAALPVMTTAMVVALAACGGGGTLNSDDSKDSGSSKDGKTLNVFQFKAEIAKDMEKMAKAYEKETGVKVVVQTVGGGSDYGAALKSQFASGNEPDVFNNGGFTEAKTWQDKLEDLSDEKWVSDLTDLSKEPMTIDGKLYGMPMNLEGYGFIYNKEIFKKAGITELPKTLTELTEASKKLKADGVTPFSIGYGEWWILGNHLMNIPMAQQDDPDQFIADLNSGKGKFEDNKQFKEFMNLFDLTIEYGNKNPLTTDYNTQVSQFAEGKTAMIQQGNWAQQLITDVNPDIEMGFIPMPINDDKEKMDRLPVGVPNNWVVNKNSKNKEEGKKFLEWMATSDTGKDYMVNKFKFIPAFKSIEAADLGPLADDIIKYSKEDKTISWNWFKYPDGAVNEFGAIMQAYVGKQKTSEEMLQDFTKTWQKMKK